MALEKWKQKLGSEATYSKLIAVFERACCLKYADTVRKIVVDMSSEQTDDSSDSDTPTPPSPQAKFQVPVFPAPNAYMKSTGGRAHSPRPLQSRDEGVVEHSGVMVGAEECLWVMFPF